jgi:flagellar hook-associated protein 3 FlgL
MRVTQSMITRNYLRNMNTGLSNLSETQERMTSGSKFSKASQNVADAARALKVRQSLFDNEQYLTNITQISGRLLSAESNLSSINAFLSRLTSA